MSYETKSLADGTQLILLRGTPVASAETYRHAMRKIARFKREGHNPDRRSVHGEPPHRLESERLNSGRRAPP